MSEYDGGLHATLRIPAVYDLFQWIVGAYHAREVFVQECLRPWAGARILDVGCGTGEIIKTLPAVEYWGYDPNPAYVRAAQLRFPSARFVCADRLDKSGLQRGRYDAVMAVNVLHHLEDHLAASIPEQASRLLRPGGAFCSLDPCFVPGQHPFARWMIEHDRGRSVRTEAGYRGLASRWYAEIATSVHHDLLRVPFTFCTMRATV